MPLPRWRFLRPFWRSDASGAYLAAIVESSVDAIIAKDLDGVIRAWNRAAEQIFGYSAAEAIGRSISFIIPPERQEEETDILGRLRRGERVDAFETVRLARGGRPVPVSLSVSPVRDASGRIIGASKIARDITEQKRAAEELAEQREWLQTTLESIGDGLLATNVQGEVRYLNPVAEHLTGWRREDAEGRACGEVFRIVNEQTRQPGKNPVQRALAEGVVVGLANHTVLIAADGTERPIDDSAAPIRYSDGRVAGAVLVFRDVSERRQAEDERRAAAADRERLLESERAARADAERANRGKDEFVAMVSHELRTPLNAIVGWTELLANDATDAETRRRAIDALRRNTRLQAQLVSDLLDVSRMLSGKLRLETQSVDLSALLDDAIQIAESAATAKGVQIRRTPTERGGFVVGDPGRLQQVISNLLSNAIKFTPAGGMVEMSLRVEDGQAAITVSDTGVGIKPAFLASVFDRFRQAETSTTRRFGGLGLGLAIVKQLVEIHGGSVQAESAGEGMGATFTVSLPASLEPGPLQRPAETDALNDASPIAAPSLQALSILVVEDDDDTRDLLQRILEAQGAHVVTARDGPEALVLMAQHAPELLVSDLGLPGMDGYELLARIRADKARGAMLPAIAVTAFARPEDRQRVLLAGYQAHIAKPVQPNDLLATVASFADLIRARRGSERPRAGSD
jgi:PAS domain S-box-containing protein